MNEAFNMRSEDRQGRRRRVKQDNDAFQERFEKERRPSLFAAAIPSTISKESYNVMSPADKLLFTLHKYFSAQEVRSIEDQANEIQHFLYVDQLKEFGDRVRQTTIDLLHGQKLANRAAVANAVEALRREVIIVPPPTSDLGSRKTSVVKSCLRQSGEAKVQSPGERLADRLGSLLDPKIADIVTCRADNVASKEALEELITFLNQQLVQKISADEANAKSDVTCAVARFTEQILSKHAQMKQMQEYMEELRDTTQHLMKDMHLEQDLKTKTFNLSKSIEADYNATEDDGDDEFAVKRMVRTINELLRLMDQMLPMVPLDAKTKIQRFQALSKQTLTKL